MSNTKQITVGIECSGLSSCSMKCENSEITYNDSLDSEIVADNEDPNSFSSNERVQKFSIRISGSCISHLTRKKTSEAMLPENFVPKRQFEVNRLLSLQYNLEPLNLSSSLTLPINSWHTKTGKLSKLLKAQSMSSKDLCEVQIEDCNDFWMWIDLQRYFDLKNCKAEDLHILEWQNSSSLETFLCDQSLSDLDDTDSHCNNPRRHQNDNVKDNVNGNVKVKDKSFGNSSSTPNSSSDDFCVSLMKFLSKVDFESKKEKLMNVYMDNTLIRDDTSDSSLLCDVIIALHEELALVERCVNQRISSIRNHVYDSIVKDIHSMNNQYLRQKRIEDQVEIVDEKPNPTSTNVKRKKMTTSKGSKGSSEDENQSSGQEKTMDSMIGDSSSSVTNKGKSNKTSTGKKTDKSCRAKNTGNATSNHYESQYFYLDDDLAYDSYDEDRKKKKKKKKS